MGTDGQEDLTPPPQDSGNSDTFQARYVRVLTEISPSWVSWFEIEVTGSFPGQASSQRSFQGHFLAIDIQETGVGQRIPIAVEVIVEVEALAYDGVVGAIRVDDGVVG